MSLVEELQKKSDEVFNDFIQTFSELIKIESIKSAEKGYLGIRFYV